jgi:nucleoside-diphosphate-sugar epimerase
MAFRRSTRRSAAPWRIARRPPRASDARHTGADGTRAEALLGYRPETDLATGLAAQVAWVWERQRAANG